VTLIGGNHDYWLGSHLIRDYGFDLAPDGLVAEHQGRRLRIDHGDETLSDDRGYLALKTVIRNRVFLGAARLIHPDLTFWLADRLSHGSRWLDEKQMAQGQAKRPLRLKAALDEDVDAFIFGHLHLAFHQRYRHWDIVCLGDWILRFSYARLADGQLTLQDDRGRRVAVEEVDDPDRPPRCRLRVRPGEGSD
jgi:UDP-2,3-diacylglucosamine hydrolase